MHDVTMRSARRSGSGLLLILALLLPGGLAGQEATAAVEGQVVEEGTGAPLAAVTVRVLGTDRSTITNEDGRFRISRLQPGTRSLAFETLGYEQRVVEVVVTAGSVERVEVALRSAPLAVEGLVVTSQKRQQAVQEVPITIAVLDGDFLETTGIQEYDRLSAYTPGLEVQLQSPNNPGIVIRGITSDDGDARVQPRVSVFQDGVSISKARGAVVELFDLERVEVLKGPQGTLFGRAAEIGAVHVIQNKARDETSGKVTGGVGRFGELYASGHANAPIVDGQLFGRVAGVYNRRDGYIENLGGGDLNGKETVALRGLLRYAPSEFTDVDLIVNWQRDTPPGTSFKSGVFAPSATDPADPFSPARLGGDDRFEDLFVDRSVWGATLLADHVLSPEWTLQAIGAYRAFDSYESFDADGTAASALQFAEEAAGQQYSLELRALVNTGGRFSGFGGVNAFREDGYQTVLVRTDERVLFPFLARVFHFQSRLAGGQVFPLLTPPVLNGEPMPVATIPPLVSPLGPVLCPENPTCFDPLIGQPLAEYHEESFKNLGTTTAYEVFADGTFEVTDRLGVTAGVRATYEILKGGLAVPQAETASLLGHFTGSYPNLLFPRTEGGGEVSREESFTSWVGRVAADFEVSRDLNVYGTVARGRRPPVIEEIEDSIIREFEILPEEVVWSYEAGAKGFLLDRRLQYDVAGFYYDYSDFQTDRAEVTESGVRFITDVGQATAFGGELGLTARPAELLSLFGSYAYINASFDDVNPRGEPQRLAGNTFRLTPEHSVSLGLGLTSTLAGIPWFVRPNYTWKSRVYFEEEWQEETFFEGTAPGLYQEPYGLLNVRAGAELLDGRASLELWGTNLLDQEFIIDAGNTGLLFYAPTYIGGPPLQFGLQVTARL